MPELVNDIHGRVTIPALQSLITGLAAALGLGAMTWAAIDATAWLLAGALGFAVGAALAWAWLLWDSHTSLYEVTMTTSPETPAEPEREPLKITTYGQREDGGRMARFIADARLAADNRSLRRRGWCEQEIAERRGKLIEQGRAAWKNDADHKQGWRLL